MDPFSEKQNRQVKPGKYIASWLYIKDKSMSWSSHNKLPFARIDQLGFLYMKCQWKVLTNVSGKKKGSVSWDFWKDHKPWETWALSTSLRDDTTKNHGCVNLVSLATFTVIRQRENLSNEDPIVRPTDWLQ